MSLLKELLILAESDKKYKKKSKKDKSAKRYPGYIGGNMLFTNICSGSLSGTMKDKQ